MLIKPTITIGILSLIMFTACGGSKPTPITDLPDAGRWKLVFHDEFNEDKLDTTRWNTCYPRVDGNGCTNSGNHELEWYQPDEVIVDDGMLHLRAQGRSVKEGYPYTSGMVTTYQKFSFQYGYVEARFKVPAGQGMWPALWLLPEDDHWPPEIDIFEVLGDEPSTIHTTLHYTTDGKNHYSSGSYWNGPDFSAGFHFIGLLWGPHLISWTVDGIERYSVTENIPQEPFYLIANLAVGGDWPGSPNSSTIFPGYYDIDYIRVYQNEGYVATAQAPTPTPSGGINRVHVAKIIPVDENNGETHTFSPGTITWQAQVVNQDGRPYSGALVTMSLVDQNGKTIIQIPNMDQTDRLGWVTFLARVNDPGVYIIKVDKITLFSGIASYDLQKDTKAVKITVK